MFGDQYFQHQWKQEVEDAALNNPYRYTGQYQDAESGNYYLRGRYYDPESRRFTQQDPMRHGGNWYSYCGNDPINYTDPSGYVERAIRDWAKDNGNIAVVYPKPTYTDIFSETTGKYLYTEMNATATINMLGKTATYVLYAKSTEGFVTSVTNKSTVIDNLTGQSTPMDITGVTVKEVDANGGDQIRATLDHIVRNFGIPSEKSIINGLKEAGGMKVYLGVHKVAFNNYHTSIMIVINNNSDYYSNNYYDFQSLQKYSALQYLTIGAGPDFNWGCDYMISGYNREKDEMFDNKVELISLGEITDDEIAELLNLQQNYAANNRVSNYSVEYDLWPSDNNDGYNSNSFTKAMLDAAGIEAPEPTYNVPGWDKPVPSIWFDKPQMPH